MKNRFLEWARCLLISPELLIVSLVLVGGYFWPAIPIRLGSFVQFSKVDGWVLALAGAPVTLIGFSFAQVRKILRPETGRSNLIAWPEYWRLRIQVLSALAWEVIGLLGWLVGGGLVQNGNLLIGTTVAVAGMSAAAVATASVSVARITIQDVLEGAPMGHNDDG